MRSKYSYSHVIVAAIACFASVSCISAQPKLADQVQLHGQWQPGGSIIGSAPAGSKIYLNDVQIATLPDGRFVFGFGRDEQAVQRIAVEHGEQTWSKQFNLQAREYSIQRVNGIAKTIMHPSAKAIARSSKEAGQVKAARTRQLSIDSFTQDFICPAKGPITGVYGSQRVYNGVAGRPHYGLDIAGPVGTPVYAPAAGVVTLNHPDMFYSGGTLILDHGLGFSSTMIHLSEIVVEEGDSVDQGELVAYMGASGRATGPHLDWRINWFSERLDPALLDFAVGSACDEQT